jgi:hypothetical protein
MCTPCMLKELYLSTCSGYLIFLEFIDNKKIQEGGGADDNCVYTLHIKRLGVKDLG